MLYCAKIMWSDSDRKLSLSMVMATDTTDGQRRKELTRGSQYSVALLLGSPSSDTNGKVVRICKKTCMHLLIIYVTIYGMKNKISLERQRFLFELRLMNNKFVRQLTFLFSRLKLEVTKSGLMHYNNLKDITWLTAF